MDGGDRSPFYDSCELYQMCALETDSLNRDDYAIACAKCADGHFPALDDRFNQFEHSLCSGPNKFPTFCYPLNVASLVNLDYDEYCPNNNPHQINQCNWWMNGQWQVKERSYGAGTDTHPFVGCKEMAFCG